MNTDPDLIQIKQLKSVESSETSIQQDMTLCQVTYIAEQIVFPTTLVATLNKMD